MPMQIKARLINLVCLFNLMGVRGGEGGGHNCLVFDFSVNKCAIFFVKFIGSV